MASQSICSNIRRHFKRPCHDSWVTTFSLTHLSTPFNCMVLHGLTFVSLRAQMWYDSYLTFNVFQHIHFNMIINIIFVYSICRLQWRRKTRQYHIHDKTDQSTYHKCLERPRVSLSWQLRCGEIPRIIFRLAFVRFSPIPPIKAWPLSRIHLPMISELDFIPKCNCVLRNARYRSTQWSCLATYTWTIWIKWKHQGGNAAHAYSIGWINAARIFFRHCAPLVIPDAASSFPTNSNFVLHETVTVLFHIHPQHLFDCNVDDFCVDPFCISRRAF